MYEFTLLFKLKDPNKDPMDYLDQLYEAGCDDAIMGVGRRGSISLDFSRESHNEDHAIASAIRQVFSVIPDAQLISCSAIILS